MPSVSVGTMVAPIALESQASEAMTPSGVPLPNFSGVFERRLASE